MDFAPEFNSPEPRDLTRVSQGYRDDTIGTALSGIGDTIGGVVKWADDTYKRMARDEARAKVDDVQNGTIDQLQVEAGNPNARMRSDRTPDEIKRFQERARMFRSGVDAGTTKESSYWGMLDAGARQLRSRYPGYRDVIDEAFKEFTGAVPANTLIRELRQEAATLATKTNDPAKQLWELEKAMSNEGNLPPDYVRGKYDIGQLVGIRNEWNARRAVVAHQTSVLGLREKEGKVTDEERFALARNQWGLAFKEATDRSGTAYGKSQEQIDAMIRQAQGRSFTAGETQKMTEMAEGQINILNRQFEQFLDTPRPELGMSTYRVKLTPTQLQEMKAQQLDTITDSIRQSVLDPKNGHVGRAARLIKMNGDAMDQALLENPTFAKASSTNRLLGQVGLGMVLQSEGSLTEIQRHVKEVSIAKMADPENPKTFPEIMAEVAKQKGGAEPAFVRSIIKTANDIVSNPDVSIATRKQMVETLYGDGNATFLTLVNRNPAAKGDPLAAQRTFQMMANPKVSKELHKLSQETGDPSLFNKYEKWVVNQAYAINSTDISTVSTAMDNAPLLDIRFNPTSFTFEAVDRPMKSSATGLNRAQQGIRNVYEDWRTAGIKQAVAKVNETLVPLRDIAEIRKYDREVFASVVLGQMNLQARTRYPTSTVDNIFTTLNKALGGKGTDTWLREGLTEGVKNPFTPGLRPAYQQPGDDRDIGTGFMNWLRGKGKEIDSQRSKDRMAQ